MGFSLQCFKWNQVDDGVVDNKELKSTGRVGVGVGGYWYAKRARGFPSGK